MRESGRMFFENFSAKGCIFVQFGAIFDENHRWGWALAWSFYLNKGLKKYKFKLLESFVQAMDTPVIDPKIPPILDGNYETFYQYVGLLLHMYSNHSV